MGNVRSSLWGEEFAPEKGTFDFVDKRGHPFVMVDLFSDVRLPFRGTLIFTTNPMGPPKIPGCVEWSFGLGSSCVYKINDRSIRCWTPWGESVKLYLHPKQQGVFSSKDERVLAKELGNSEFRITNKEKNWDLLFKQGRLSELRCDNGIFKFDYIKLGDAWSLDKIRNSATGFIMECIYDERNRLASISSDRKRLSTFSYRKFPELAFVDGGVIPVSNQWWLSGVKTEKKISIDYIPQDVGWKMRLSGLQENEKDIPRVVSWDVRDSTVRQINDWRYAVKDEKTIFEISRENADGKKELYSFDRKRYQIRRKTGDKDVLLTMLGTPGQSYGKPREGIVKDKAGKVIRQWRNHYDKSGQLLRTVEPGKVTLFSYDENQLVSQFTYRTKSKL